MADSIIFNNGTDVQVDVRDDNLRALMSDRDVAVTTSETRAVTHGKFGQLGVALHSHGSMDDVTLFFGATPDAV